MINNLPRKNSLDDSNNNILHSVRPSHVYTWALVNKIKVEHVLNHSWRRFLWGLFGPKGIFVSILIFIWRYHCVKSVQIRSFFWSVFSNIRTEYGEKLPQKKPEKTPYFDNFHAVKFVKNVNEKSAVNVLPINLHLA